MDEPDLSTLDLPEFDLEAFKVGYLDVDPPASESTSPEANIPDGEYTIIVQCGNEPEQQKLYKRLSKEGFECRLSTL